MNKGKIGTNAGKIWHLLSNNQRWSYDTLKEQSGLSDVDFAAAIGWLARENKIEFEGEQDTMYVFLFVNVYIG